MIKGNLTNNTKTRRKGSMLQDSLSKIKYLFVLAVLLVLPMLAVSSMQAMAGFIPLIDQTDTGTDRIVAFFDTRDGRESFIQVTNTSTAGITIHVQLFDVNSPFLECEECNFDDSLTANDTHVYNIQDLKTNGNVPVCTGLTKPTHGFMVVSVTGGEDFSLIGMFRIIDVTNGYEYRTNTAGESLFTFAGFFNIVNFNEKIRDLQMSGILHLLILQ